MNEQGLADADVNGNVDASDSRSLSDRCGFERWIRIGHEATVTAFEVVFVGSEAPPDLTVPEARTRQGLCSVQSLAHQRAHETHCGPGQAERNTTHDTQRTKD